MTDTIALLLDYVGIFFVIYLLGYATFLFLSVLIGSSILYSNRRNEKYKNEINHEFYIPISILVPAYNEEITVVDTVKSLLSLDYKIYEIIVVDDGSVDKTAEKLIQYFKMHEIKRPIFKQIQCQPEKAVYMAIVGNVQVTLVKKKNGGKADALNMGINVSKYPYFLCMDADSVLQRDSLKQIAKPILEDDKIVACGGMVGISNGVIFNGGRVEEYRMPKNLLVCMQILEYDRSFLASRIMLDQINGNLIISGAFGLFKKDTAILAGGYDNTTMGEDMELVVKLHVFCKSHEIPYSIRYAPDAVCWSQAPKKLRDLCKQRKRWYIGLVQTMWKYKGIFANYKYGLVSFVSFVYFVLYELLSPLIELLGLISVFFAIWLQLINIPFMLFFFFVYAFFGGVLSLTAFFSRCHTQNLKLNIRDVMKAVLLCIIEISVLRFVMSVIRMTALIGYRKKKDQWGSIERVKNNYKGYKEKDWKRD